MTNYFKNLSSGETVSFGKQFFDNNRGEYLAIVLRIPLFDGLKRYSEARRARNTMRITNEQRDEVMRQLQTAVEQAVLDRDGFAKETVQMEKKVEADEISYHLTLRKYEESLMSPINLQTVLFWLCDEPSSVGCPSSPPDCTFALALALPGRFRKLSFEIIWTRRIV